VCVCLQVPSIKKLYKGDIKDVPSSGPAPVLLRFEEFMKLVPTYVEVRRCAGVLFGKSFCILI